LGEIRIGTSGYSFPDWVGTVYPREFPQKAWISYYARWFNAVEINSTNYRIPSPYMMAALVRKVPKGFLFSAYATTFPPASFFLSSRKTSLRFARL